MSTKQKEVCVCDQCGAELKKPFIKLESGYDYAEIKCGRKSLSLNEGDFCNLDCFIKWVDKGLFPDKERK